MGHLKPRIREGLLRLAWAIGAIAAVFWLAASLHMPGGFWVIVAILLPAEWVWRGFSTDPPPRAYAATLRTRRLVLRRALPIDADPLHAMLSDPETTRYWHAPPHTTREETDIWFQRMLAPEHPEGCDDFIMVHRGRVIGMLGSLRLPWVSFLLSRDEWRKGLATEALTAFTRYMFDRRLLYLYAATDAQNAAARALLAKGGFHEIGRSTGLWKVQDQPAEAVHYMLHADGAAPDLAKEQALIAGWEAATAAHLVGGEHHPEQLGHADPDQQPEQQER